METPQPNAPTQEQLPGPLTPEKVRRFRAHVEAVREQIRARGVDPDRMPDPVEELIKARDAGSWE